MKNKITKIAVARRDSITIDGVPYSLKGDGVKQAKLALDASHRRMRDARVDALDEAALKALVDELAAALADAQSKLVESSSAEAVADEDEEKTPEEIAAEEEKMDAKVRARVDSTLKTIDRAREIDATIKIDSYDERAIMISAIKSVDPETAKRIDDKTSIDFVRGVFAVARPREKSAHNDARGAALGKNDDAAGDYIDGASARADALKKIYANA